MSSRPTKADLERYARHVTAERDAAALYRGLAELSEGRRRKVLEELAAIEDKHATFWAGKIAEHGGSAPDLEDFHPSRRTRELLARARAESTDVILPIVEQHERDAIHDYADEPEAPRSMLADEAGHSRALQDLMNEGRLKAEFHPGSEDWHSADKSGTLRAAIFGINDGLVSNTALVMGFAGAAVGQQVVLLAGLAGWLAGAFSMGAGEYISMQNQREAFERELEFERQEIEMQPEDEKRELQLIYEAKGIDTRTAQQVADQVMADKDVALQTMAREELGLDPDDLGSPWRAAMSSFLSFSLGAIVIVIPYFFTGGGLALGLAVAIALLALALVGGGMARLNGRPVVRGVVRQMTVGALAAGATYLFGTLFGVTIS
jgi:vacuolar iron transporter family protein